MAQQKSLMQQGGKIVRLSWNDRQLTCQPQPGETGNGFFLGDTWGGLLSSGVVAGSRLMAIDGSDVSEDAFASICEKLKEVLGTRPVDLHFQTPSSQFQLSSVTPTSATEENRGMNVFEPTSNIWATEPKPGDYGWGMQRRDPSPEPRRDYPRSRRGGGSRDRRPFERHPRYDEQERSMRRQRRPRPHPGFPPQDRRRDPSEKALESHPGFSHLVGALRLKPAQAEFGSRDYCWFRCRSGPAWDWQLGLIIKRIHDQYVVRGLNTRREKRWVTVYSHEIGELPPPEFLTARKVEQILTMFIVETHRELTLNSEIFEGGRVRIRVPVGHRGVETNVMAKVTHIHRNGQCQVEYRRNGFLATPSHMTNIPEVHQDMYRKAQQARSYLEKYHTLKQQLAELHQRGSGLGYDYDIPEGYIAELQRLQSELTLQLQIEDGVSDVSAVSVRHSRESPEASIRSVYDQISSLGRTQNTLMRRYDMLAHQLEALVEQSARGRLPVVSVNPSDSISVNEEKELELKEKEPKYYYEVGYKVHTPFGLGKIEEIREDGIHVVSLAFGMGYLNVSALIPLHAFLSESRGYRDEIEALQHECTFLRSRINLRTPSDAFPPAEVDIMDVQPSPLVDPMVGDRTRNERIVCEWLKEKHLESYAQLLLDNGFDHFDTLTIISAEDCKDLNFKLGHAKKLIFEVGKLVNQGPDAVRMEEARVAALLDRARE